MFDFPTQMHTAQGQVEENTDTDDAISRELCLSAVLFTFLDLNESLCERKDTDYCIPISTERAKERLRSINRNRIMVQYIHSNIKLSDHSSPEPV